MPDADYKEIISLLEGIRNLLIATNLSLIALVLVGGINARRK